MSATRHRGNDGSVASYTGTDMRHSPWQTTRQLRRLETEPTAATRQAVVPKHGIAHGWSVFRDGLKTGADWPVSFGLTGPAV